MFAKLTNEEEQCIDNILTTGLNEINDVPSLALSSMSNLSTPCVGQSSNLNLSRNNRNNSLSKNNLNGSNSIDNKKDREDTNKSNSSVSLHLSSSINERENILMNNEENENSKNNDNIKNIYKNNITRFSDENILNIINSTVGSSNKKTEVDLSNSTQKLIDKYINIDINTHHKEVKNIKTSLNNNIMKIEDNNPLSPSFVNLNNNISNIDNVQKPNIHNEEELLNGENSLIKINNLLIDNNDKEKLSLMDLSEKENINHQYKKSETNINLNENNDYKNQKNKIGNNKYNPKSVALKKLIDKIKKDENLDFFDGLEKSGENNRKHDIEQNEEKTNNSGLFTLGNATSPNLNIFKNDIKNNLIKNKNLDKGINNLKTDGDLKLVIQKIKHLEKSINNLNDSNSNYDVEYDEIKKNNEKINIMKNEINSIQNKLKSIKMKLEQQSYSLNQEQNKYQIRTFKPSNKTKSKNKNKLRKISSKKYLSIDDSLFDKHKKRNYSSQKKNYSFKNSIYSNLSLKNQKNRKKYKYLSAKKDFRLSLRSNTSNKSSKSLRSNSHRDNRGNTSYKKERREKIDYKTKYEELREKFELQREKMKSEKQNILSLQQKIKILNTKKDSYPKLYEYNKNLKEQNVELKNNLKDSEKIRHEQEKLIQSLTKEIKILKGGINLNDTETLNQLADTYLALKESLMKTSELSQSEKNYQIKIIKKNKKKKSS